MPPPSAIGSAQTAMPPPRHRGRVGLRRDAAAYRMRRQPPPRGNVLIEPVLIERHSTDRQAVADPLVAGALAFIDARRSEPIRPADVAAALGVAPRTLQRRLRAAGRDTVQGEILKARVEHAKALLAGANALLPAIALQSGFGSLAAMSRAFRRHTGRPPSAFRRQE